MEKPCYTLSTNGKIAGILAKAATRWIYKNSFFRGALWIERTDISTQTKIHKQTILPSFFALSLHLYARTYSSPSFRSWRSFSRLSLLSVFAEQSSLAQPHTLWARLCLWWCFALFSASFAQEDNGCAIFTLPLGCKTQISAIDFHFDFSWFFCFYTLGLIFTWFCVFHL